MDKSNFHSIAPNAFFLDVNNPKGLENYLKSRHVLEKEEEILSLSRPGEGNMNLVLRVKTSSRSFIIKQSRPWVEKYPEIQAPINRTNIEAQFIQICIRDLELKDFTPQLIHHLPDSFMMIVEDLGETKDFSNLYEKQRLAVEDLNTFLHYLGLLHSLEVESFDLNMDMRILNHTHIFSFPFQENNGFDLDQIQTELQILANEVIYDKKLKTVIKELGDRYLEKGTTLIHGDYYPGSILKSEFGLKVIDAEFSFLGFAEFDYAVLYAHLIMTSQDGEVISLLMDNINSQPHLNVILVNKYAGVEILRRLLGVAQLPLDISVEEKRELVEKARTLLIAS